VTIKDSSLSGDSTITIPENTDVLVPLYLVNRDPELWIQPSKFMPERCSSLPPSLSPSLLTFVHRFDGKHDFSFASYGYFPFGSGSSECMGKVFAHVEVSLFLCTLLRQYKFTPDPGYRVSITGGIYLATTNGIKVRVSALEEGEMGESSAHTESESH
jgi:cytochrome P450